jgi:uncharacterized membrane protein YidH (DUF202 family)
MRMEETESTKADVSQRSALVVNEAQLILAEKRTAFAALRTGIAIFALPLSVLSVLIATSRYYDIHHVMHLLIPLALLNAGLIALGIYLVWHSFRKLHHYDRLLADLKAKHHRLADFLD